MWKYNHKTSFVFNNGGLCLQNSLSVRLHGFYLILGFVFLGWWLLGLGLLLGVGCWVSYWVCYLGVMFGIGFVCLWVGKYVIMPFNSREGVSVGLFNYRF